MNRILFGLANGFAGAVLILIVLDPTRPLAPIFVLLALAVLCAFLPRFLRRQSMGRPRPPGANDSPSR